MTVCVSWLASPVTMTCLFVTRKSCSYSDRIDWNACNVNQTIYYMLFSNHRKSSLIKNQISNKILLILHDIFIHPALQLKQVPICIWHLLSRHLMGMNHYSHCHIPQDICSLYWKKGNKVKGIFITIIWKRNDH